MCGCPRAPRVGQSDHPRHASDCAKAGRHFNRRSSHHRGLLFYLLVEQAVELGHVPLTAIVGGRS